MKTVESNNTVILNELYGSRKAAANFKEVAKISQDPWGNWEVEFPKNYFRTGIGGHTDQWNRGFQSRLHEAEEIISQNCVVEQLRVAYLCKKAEQQPLQGEDSYTYRKFEYLIFPIDKNKPFWAKIVWGEKNHYFFNGQEVTNKELHDFLKSYTPVGVKTFKI